MSEHEEEPPVSRGDPSWLILLRRVSISLVIGAFAAKKYVESENMSLPPEEYQYLLFWINRLIIVFIILSGPTAIELLAKILSKWKNTT